MLADSSAPPRSCGREGERSRVRELSTVLRDNGVAPRRRTCRQWIEGQPSGWPARALRHPLAPPERPQPTHACFRSAGYPRRPPRVSAAGLQSPANEARRSGPHAFLTYRGVDPSSNCRPAASSSRSLSSAIPAVAARSATALRERPQTGVPFAWSPAARNQAGTTECDAGRELQPSSAGVQKENETHLCQAASAHDAPTLWSSISA